MTGFNLPPGCSVSDIPGNRPEDQAAEALYDSIYNLLDGIQDDATKDRIAEQFYNMVMKARENGYQVGMTDERMAKQQPSEQALRLIERVEGGFALSYEEAELLAAEFRRIIS